MSPIWLEEAILGVPLLAVSLWAWLDLKLRQRQGAAVTGQQDGAQEQSQQEPQDRSRERGLARAKAMHPTGRDEFWRIVRRLDNGELAKTEGKR